MLTPFPPWILKRRGLKTSGQRLISSNRQTIETSIFQLNMFAVKNKLFYLSFKIWPIFEFHVFFLAVFCLYFFVFFFVFSSIFCKVTAKSFYWLLLNTNKMFQMVKRTHKKNLGKAQSPPQELEEGQCSLNLYCSSVQSEAVHCSAVGNS